MLSPAHSLVGILMLLIVNRVEPLTNGVVAAAEGRVARCSVIVGIDDVAREEEPETIIIPTLLGACAPSNDSSYVREFFRLASDQRHFPIWCCRADEVIAAHGGWYKHQGPRLENLHSHCAVLNVSWAAATVDNCEGNFNWRSVYADERTEDVTDKYARTVGGNELSTRCVYRIAGRDNGALKLDALPRANNHKRESEERNSAGKRGVWISPDFVPPPLLWLLIGASGIGTMLGLQVAGWSAIDRGHRLAGIGLWLAGLLLGASTLFGLLCWPLVVKWWGV